MATEGIQRGEPLQPRHFEGQVIPGAKPIFIVLIILGVVGIGAGAVGVVSYGVHQGWWSAGILNQFSFFNQLSRINAITLMAAGGGGGIVLLLIGIIGIVKQTQAGKSILPVQENVLTNVLMAGNFTYVIQANGKYALVAKDAHDQVKILKRDIDSQLLISENNGRFEANDDAFNEIEKEFSLDVGQLYATAQLPGDCAEAKRRITEQNSGDPSLLKKVSEILSNPNFRADPKGFRAYIAQIEANQSAETRDISERAFIAIFRKLNIHN